MGYRKVALIYTEIEDLWALGMRSISAVVREAGYASRLIMMPSYGTHYSAKVLENLQQLVAGADVIAVSSLSRGSHRAAQVLQNLRPLNRVTLWGGYHASLNPEDCTRYADLVCRGEGEEFMLEVLRRIETPQDRQGIPNAVYRKNGRIVTNELAPLIRDLDKLPLLDFSFEDEFHLRGDEFTKVDSLPGENGPILFNGSRGCAFQCHYCCNAKMKSLYKGQGRYDRKMGVHKYIEHIAKLREQLPQRRYFYFVDEDFFSRGLEEIAEFSRLYKEKVGLPFECMASPVKISKEKMDLLVDAGLRQLDIGVESGSERTKKDIYNRYMSNEAVKNAAHLVSSYSNVASLYFFIIGNPYEEREDLLDTISLIGELPPPFRARMYNLVFFPGSLLYESAIRDGIIAGKDDSGYELDFLGGLNYSNLAWKRKNLFLNGILFLMNGRSSCNRVGIIPRFIMSHLLQDKVIEFNSRHPFMIEVFILGMRVFIRTRKSLLDILKQIRKKQNYK